MDRGTVNRYDSATIKKPDISIRPYRRLVTGLNVIRRGVRALRPNGSGDSLLIYTLGGKGFFRGQGEVSFLIPGSIAYIPEGLAHDYGASEDTYEWTILWTHFYPWPHWDELLQWPTEKSGIKLLQFTDDDLRSVVEEELHQMHRSEVSAHPHREILAMNALERTLIQCTAINPLQMARMDSRVEKVIDFLHQNMGESVTVSALAKTVNLSPSRLAHLFTEHVGLSPLKYLENLRLERARDLLSRAGRPMSEIASEVGFSDPFYFSRRFQKHYGLSPSAFRKKTSIPSP